MLSLLLSITSLWLIMTIIMFAYPLVNIQKTISMAMFNSYVSHYHRLNPLRSPLNHHKITIFLVVQSPFSYGFYQAGSSLHIIFNSFLYVYQRVNLHFPMVFLWFSYGFPIFPWVFPWFPHPQATSHHMLGLAALLLAWPSVGRREALHARQLRDARRKRRGTVCPPGEPKRDDGLRGLDLFWDGLKWG